MKNEMLKGLIIRNFLYLIIFFIIYFPMVVTAQYTKAQICGVEVFTTYCNNIPSSTVTAMNFLLYVIVPLSAIIWTFMASQEPQTVYYPR